MEPGETCAEGGVRWLAGVDTDRSETLAEDEVDSSFVVCNGLIGVDGEDGEDGVATVFGTTELSPGDEDCPMGGALLSSGPDTNDSGELDEDEVEADFPLCNGAASVARLEALDPGEACPAGGSILAIGDDANGAR